MQKDTINGLINAHVKKHLSPTDAEKKMVSDEYETLCGFVGGTCFQTGSYARFTSTTPVNDLDVIWKIPDSFLGSETKKRMEEIHEYDPSDILKQLAQNLETAYRDAGRNIRIVAQSHSVGVYFGNDEDFSIDIVPAVSSGKKNDYGEDIYWVPEVARLSKSQRRSKYESSSQIGWLLSDPRGYIADARELNEVNPAFRKAAKFMRKWRRACKKQNPELQLKSFHLELMVGDIIRQNPGISTYETLATLFDAHDQYFTTPQFPDRADSNRFVDSYLTKLKESEKKEVHDLMKIASDKLKSTLGEDVTTEDAQETIEDLLSADKSTTSTENTFSPATYTPPTAFQPQRAYGSNT